MREREQGNQCPVDLDLTCFCPEGRGPRPPKDTTRSSLCVGCKRHACPGDSFTHPGLGKITKVLLLLLCRILLLQLQPHIPAMAWKPHQLGCSHWSDSHVDLWGSAHIRAFCILMYQLPPMCHGAGSEFVFLNTRHVPASSCET